MQCGEGIFLREINPITESCESGMHVSGGGLAFSYLSCGSSRVNNILFLIAKMRLKDPNLMKQLFCP